MSLRTATRSLRPVLRRGECGCSRTLTSVAPRIARSVVAPRPVSVSRIAALAPRAFSTSSIALKEKRDKWAENPIITYDEVKAISEQPSDVSNSGDLRSKLFS